MIIRDILIIIMESIANIQKNNNKGINTATEEIVI